MTSLADRIGAAARIWPGRLAVVDTARGAAGRFSYAALDERASRLATWLRAAGVGAGDRVGLLARNGVEVLDAFYACGKLRAIFVPYNWRLAPAELADLAALTEPAVVIGAAEFEAGLAGLASHESRVLDLGAYEAVLASVEPLAETGPEVPPVDPEEIACLLFTGGTTGGAKAARVSHRMVAWNTLTTILHELDRDDVTVTHTPMFHTGGLLVYTVPLLSLGGTVVLMPRWDPDELLRLVATERVTMFFCVPAQYAALLDSPAFTSADLSSVRFLTSGGAPLPVDLIERWRAVHDTPFKQGFGMTEFGPGAFSMGPEQAVAKAGSIGRPNTFVEAAIVDPSSGRPLGPGAVGELVLRGPAAFSGYFRDPAASAAAFDGAGWFHTGDLARIDHDGFTWIVDRLKDMYVSGGENVYPVEVERVLRRHPAVADCAVVGVPDERWGEAGRAFVVIRAGAAVEADELRAFARAHLAGYKVPRDVRFVAGLPYSPAGKVLKRELRALA